MSVVSGHWAQHEYIKKLGEFHLKYPEMVSLLLRNQMLLLKNYAFFQIMRFSLFIYFNIH